MKYLLTCTKTGCFWPCFDHRHGDKLALKYGLKDYEINPTENK